MHKKLTAVGLVCHTRPKTKYTEKTKTKSKKTCWAVTQVTTHTHSLTQSEWWHRLGHFQCANVKINPFVLNISMSLSLTFSQYTERATTTW